MIKKLNHGRYLVKKYGFELRVGCWEDRMGERETWGVGERNEWMLVLINDIKSLIY
jgi:hypothetical protein